MRSSHRLSWEKVCYYNGQIYQHWSNNAVICLFHPDAIEYLRDEKNQAARAAYITSIGFLGIIIARRGLIRRTTYGLIGAASAAALCNPSLAKDYAEIGCSLAKEKLIQLYSQYGGVCFNVSISTFIIVPNNSNYFARCQL